MEIIKVKNYESMSLAAFSIIKDRISKNRKVNIGFATGSTPIGTYELLRESYKNKEISFQGIRSFNLDEYVGLEASHPKSYHYFMFDKLFNHIDIKHENVYIPSGVNVNSESECNSYERLIEKYKGIDFQILGIGNNGHIAFNEPGTSFNQKTHMVELDKSTIEANARFFTNIEEVPKQAITMGLDTIMRSKEILLLISGKSKKEAFKRLMEGEITEDFPASILKKHPNVTVIVDEEACSGE